MLQAGSGAVFEERILALADAEQLLQLAQGAARRSGARERTEVATRPPSCSAMEGQPRKCIARRDVDVRKALVVPQHDVVARAMLLDQVVLEQERLGLGVRHRDFDRVRVRHQRARLRRELLGGAKVAGDALLQVARLPDVENTSESIGHPIHARIVAQGSKVGLCVEPGGVLFHGGGRRRRPSYCTVRPTGAEFAARGPCRRYGPPLSGRWRALIPFEQLQQSVPVGQVRELHVVRRTELAHDSRAVGAHRLRAQAQAFGDVREVRGSGRRVASLGRWRLPCAPGGQRPRLNRHGRAAASLGDPAGVPHGGRADCRPVRRPECRFAEAEESVTFDLNFPTEAGDVYPLRLDVGETLFVLGANGTGKSSLMFRFTRQNRGNVRKVSAHRQTWMQSDALDLTPSNKLQTEQQIQDQDRNDQSRYRDPFAAQRASIAIFELVDAENRRARAMARAYDDQRMADLASEAKVESPIAAVNALLRESHIPIEISIRDNEQVTASKNGGPAYGAAQLSDGERNALLISANVLTAPPASLLLIDEPERHLHRSIIAPLLGALFARRKDCGFVISTHDAELALESRESRTLLLRSCVFGGSGPAGVGG